jgi:hypothetical protein
MFLVESTLWPMGNHVAMPNPMPDPIKLTDSCPFLDLKEKPGFSFKTYQQKHLVKPHLYPHIFPYVSHQNTNHLNHPAPALSTAHNGAWFPLDGRQSLTVQRR